MDTHQLTHIFCQIDDFCEDFVHFTEDKLLTSSSGEKRRGPACSLSDSEIMTILVAFQSSGYRNFKIFYTGFLARFFTSEFPTLPSYNRFIEIMHRVTLQLILFSQLNAGKKTGIYYIDSTCLPVCHLKRSRRHKTFEKIAAYGRTSVSWFFGLKLHIVINDQGQLIAFKITRGNVSDSKACESLLQCLQGLAFGDKGYISETLFAKLLEKGLKLIT